MKKIVLTVHKFFPDHRAGTEVLTLKCAQELQARGFEVRVVTANPPDLDARRRDGAETSSYIFEGVPVDVVEEPLRLKGYTFTHEYFHPLMKQYFDRLFETYKPDLLHIFHAQNLSASIIDSALAHNVPVVLSTTDFWFVCPIVQLKRPDGALCRGPSKGALNCLTCYTPRLFPPKNEVADALTQRFPALKFQRLKASLPKPVADTLLHALRLAYIATKLKGAVDATCARPEFLRQSINKAKAIMVPTRLMRDIFVENGINADLIQHVPFGLDTSSLNNFQTKTKSEVVRFGFIGTVFEHKGVDLLVEAFQRVHPEGKASLTIYGDMNQFPDYAEKVRDLAKRDLPNSQHIEFAGTFPNEKLGEVLSSIDVLVVPSRWYENTPLVIQSALATKTPLIVTNLGGMSELIKEGVNGFLFKVNDITSLSQCLQRFIDEPSLVDRLRANIAPERTVKDMVDDIQAVYAGALGELSTTLVTK